jgi:rhodanese-related sulfurtransferase
MSPNFYRLLTERLGYKNVRMFSAGLPVWKATGLPVHAEPEFLKSLQDEAKPSSYILVDARTQEKAKKEHIANAVNYPAAKVEELFQDLPKNKKARIIIYADSMQEAEKMARTLRVNAYDEVSVLKGGLQAWKEKGYPVANNTLAAKIDFKADKLPGRIGADEFKAIAAGTPADKVILDLRRPDERAKGKIASAVSIPVDTLDWRWSELPKDKEIIIHCAAGPRASIGYDILKEHGLKTRFFYGDFKWNQDGSFEAKEK